MILNARRIRHQGAGEPLILLAIEDVTEQAHAEEALRLNEEHSRRLADSMPEMAWSARPDGYVDYYNERWYEFTRLPRGKWGDASWAPALDPEHVERVRQAWYGGALLSGERFEIEARFRDPAAGGYRWHLIRADPARDKAGQIVRLFGTAADIEQQKRARRRSKKPTVAKTSSSPFWRTSFETRSLPSSARSTPCAPRSQRCP